MHEHATLVDQLGGGTVVAKAVWGEEGDTDKRREAVYKWKQNGIPWRWRGIIARLAEANNIALPSDFLMPAHVGSGSGEAVAG